MANVYPAGITDNVVEARHSHKDPDDLVGNSWSMVARVEQVDTIPNVTETPPEAVPSAP